MLRTPFASERIQMTDAKTGIKVIQLTSYPSPSAHVPYDWPSITPDNKRIILYSQRWTARAAPWDIYRVDADGLNLFQLTEDGDCHSEEGYYGRQWSALTLDGATLYVLWNRVLRRIDVETGADETLADLGTYAPEGVTFDRIGISSTGKRLIISRWGTTSSLRYDLETDEVDEVDYGGYVKGCVQTEPRVLVQRGEVIWGTEELPGGGRRVINAGSKLYLYSVDEDGGDARMVSPLIFAHCTLLGRDDRVQGCGLPPERCIWLAEVGKEPRRLAQGPYFWHSAGSMDGEWIVADTNWPDNGLQLVHVPTGHFRTLCYPRATLDHVEYGHTHPCISQDGRLVVFRSDRTHIQQVYVAHVTDEFRESIIAGELDRPRDKWL